MVSVRERVGSRRWRRSLFVGVLGPLLASCGDSPARPESDGMELVAMGEASFAMEVASDVPLSVRVQEPSGTPRSDVMVTWSVVSGGGQITPTAQASDDSGRADAVWQLGVQAGLQRAAASIHAEGATHAVEFVADARPGPPISMALSADSVLISARLEAVYLAPTFVDVHGNAAEAMPVSWSSADPVVATVAGDGLVTGRGPGTTYVTGSAGASTDSLLVTVSLRGAITVTFDDGWRTTYTQALPVFREFDLAANVAVNPVTVTWSAYLGVPDLQELHAAGWSMVSHTVSHAHLPDLSDAELDRELRESKEFLDAQGFRGTDVLIVPYHDWGPREQTAAARYYRAARAATASSFWPRDSLVSWMPQTPFELTAMEADTLPYTTAEGRERLRALLQRTADEGVFVDIFFHQVPAERVPALRQTLSVLDEFRDRVLPYHQLFPRSPREVR